MRGPAGGRAPNDAAAAPVEGRQDFLWRRGNRLHGPQFLGNRRRARGELPGRHPRPFHAGDRGRSTPSAVPRDLAKREADRGSFRNVRMRGKRRLLFPGGNGMQSCQLIEREVRFLISQRETDDDVLTADLPPKPIRRPFLRGRPAQTLDPNKVPFRHGATLRSWFGSRCVATSYEDIVGGRKQKAPNRRLR